MNLEIKPSMILSDTFLNELNPGDLTVMNRLRSFVMEADPKIIEKAEKIMNADHAVVYLQEDVFKFEFAKTEGHYPFNSMVIYANPEINRYVKDQAET